jgi:hypothetical protein
MNTCRIFVNTVIAASSVLVVTAMLVSPEASAHIVERHVEVSKQEPSNPSSKSSFLIAANVDLTGRWQCDDGGIYYIRQVGTEVFWYGESPDRKTWSNVYHGFIQGNSIVGSWVDVPKGDIRQAGEMDLNIDAANRLSATRKTGGFGGSSWRR